MGESRRATGGAERVGNWVGRGVRAWLALPRERRLAAVAAIGLLLTLFLPWYQETVIANGSKTLQSASASLTGWSAFSFVEAAVLLVALGVLVLLFQRAEGRAFHLPGGDGWVITAAGLWTCVLVVWRIFDKQGGTVHGQYATTYGIEWGIFVALAVAALLAYAGSRIRAAHRPEPPLPGEEHQPAPPPSSAQPSDRPIGWPPPVRAEGAFARSHRDYAPASRGSEDATARIRRARPQPTVEDPDPTTTIRGPRRPYSADDDDPATRSRRRDRPSGADDDDPATRSRHPDLPLGLGDDATTRRLPDQHREAGDVDSALAVPRPDPRGGFEDLDPTIRIEDEDASTMRAAQPATPAARARRARRSDDEPALPSRRQGEDGRP